MTGKEKCNLLRAIRREIAENNGIVYLAAECDVSDCSGSCGKCEAEIQYLDQELEKIVSRGDTISVANISLNSYFENAEKDKEDTVEEEVESEDEDVEVVEDEAYEIVPVFGHMFGDLLYEDEKIAVTYKGFYKFNGLFAQGYRIRFVIENKTGYQMRIEGKSITANGYVIETGDLFNSEVDPYKKVVDTVLMGGAKLRSVDIISVEDFDELSLYFEYRYGNQKGYTPELFMVPCNVIG